MADLSITATSVVPGTATVLGTATAGETIAAGETVYIKASDSRAWKAQCDGTTEESTVVGVALNGGAAGQPIRYQQAGAMTIGATTVKTTTYMLSALAGKICPQADLVSTNKIVRVGYATGVAGEFVVDIKVTGAAV